MKTLFLAFMLFMPRMAQAQLLDVPNRSFELWHSIGNHEDPDLWTTNNDSTFIGIRKDSVMYWGGKYSMQIMQDGIAISTLFKPRGFYFSCYYRSTFVGTDTAVVKSITYLNGSAIDSAAQYLLSSQNYMFWSAGVALTHFPDSVRIMFVGGHNAGTTVNVDDAYTWSESVEDISNQVHPRVTPNPMISEARFRFNNPEHTCYRWLLTDITGKVVMMQQQMREEEIKIQRKGLPAGMYHWQLWNEQKCRRATGTLVME